MTRRTHIPLKTQLAAALIQIGNIPHNDAKLMTAGQIISLFNLDHWPIPVAHDGPNEAWNLTWRFTGEHRLKTATRDIPAIAKVRRLTKAQEDMRRILLKPAGHKRVRKSRWPSRPFPKRRTK